MSATSDPTEPTNGAAELATATSAREPQPLKRLDGALQALRSIGLLPDAEPKTRPVTVLLENLRVLGDEAVVPIARTLAQAEVFNELVRNEVTAVSVGERYEAIAGHFDSIRDDARSMVAQVDDGRIDLREKLSNLWMRVTRGTIPSRFAEIKRTAEEVFAATDEQIRRERTIIEAYRDFRLALKEAGILGERVLKAATARLDAATAALGAAQATVDAGHADPEQRAHLELARDEHLRTLQDEDRRYQLAKDLAENLSISYHTGEVVMARLLQTTEAKERVYSQAVTFFSTNESVLTALNASFVAAQGLHEGTRTLDTLKQGVNQSLEVLAEVGDKVQTEALRSGYGPTIQAASVQKLVDAIVGFQERSFAIIAEMREASTRNAAEIATAVEQGKQRLARLNTEAGRLAHEHPPA